MHSPKSLEENNVFWSAINEQTNKDPLPVAQHDTWLYKIMNDVIRKEYDASNDKLDVLRNLGLKTIHIVNNYTMFKNFGSMMLLMFYLKHNTIEYLHTHMQFTVEDMFRSFHKCLFQNCTCIDFSLHGRPIDPICNIFEKSSLFDFYVIDYKPSWMFLINTVNIFRKYESLYINFKFLSKYTAFDDIAEFEKIIILNLGFK